MNSIIQRGGVVEGFKKMKRKNEGGLDGMTVKFLKREDES